MQGKKTVSVKFLMCLFAVVLLLSFAIGGTIAWLTSQTDPVKNTFTVGNIQITLKEHVLDANGKHKDPEEFTTTGLQNIKMVPGRVIEKDPVVTVLAGSEECYVRVLVKISWQPEADPVFAQQEYADWFTFAENWSVKRLFDGSYKTNGQYVGQDIYELRYKGTVASSNEDRVLPVFTNISVPEDLDSRAVAALEGCGIELIAQAIQAEGFDSEVAAWDKAEFPMVIPNVPELPEEEDVNP